MPKDAKKNAMEVVGPAEQVRAMNALSRSTVLAGLTPWEQHKLEWQVRKQRGADGPEARRGRDADGA